MSEFSVGIVECEIAGGPLSDQTLHEKWINGIPIIEMPPPLLPRIRKELTAGNLYQLRPTGSEGQQSVTDFMGDTPIRDYLKEVEKEFSEEGTGHATYSPVKSHPIIIDPDN